MRRQVVCVICVVVVVVALGAILIAIGAKKGLTVDGQVQAGITVLAAAVAAAYTAMTWIMARAAQSSARESAMLAGKIEEIAGSMQTTAAATEALAQKTVSISETMAEEVQMHVTEIELAHGTELVVWRVDWNEAGDRPISFYRVLNALPGPAISVAFHPIWGDYDPAPPQGAAVLRLCNEEWHQIAESRRREFDINRPNRPIGTPVLPGHSWGFVGVTGGEEDGDVLCLRWDDPVRQTRRWRCWRLRRVQLGKREHLVELEGIDGAVEACKHLCPEKAGLGSCPLEARRSETAFDQTTGRDWYGRHVLVIDRLQDEVTGT